nr:hypothetical protein [Tanacetum cinerariifolium]
IRSDNGTEFKNSDLNQFCGIKGIKREFSVLRTPQQNGIAEKKNRTLIEAARTMLADSLIPILFWAEAVNTACYVQNGMKNRTLIEAAKTMLVDSLLPIPFWAEAVNTACYVQNLVLVTKPQNKTPYELLHGRPPSIGFMRLFGCPVTILNILDTLGKCEGKVDEGFLVGYSVNSKAFRVFNSRTRIVQETLHVNFLENKVNIVGTGPTWLFDIDSLTRTMNYQPVTAGNQSNPSAGFQEEFDAGKIGEEAIQQYMLFPVWFTGSTNPQNKEGDATFDGNEHSVEHPESTVNLSPSSSALSEEQDGITKKRDKGNIPVDYFTENRDFNEDFDDYSKDSSNDVSAAGPIVPTAGQNYSNNTNLISAAGPLHSNTSPIHGNSSFQDASASHDMLENEDIVYSDNENAGAEADFNNLETSITFKMQKVWILVDLPHGKREIGTKWVYINKKDERGIVVRNKERRVAQGHTQEEGIDYEEVFAPVARIEAIRLLLAYASFMGFMVYQMDVKSAFLYETIEEEVYVYQPTGFKDPDHPDKVYKVVKALYGLHQAPRAWYETLATYLLENGFHRGQIDLCKSFETLMKDKFQMSSMGEFTFFLGLQVKKKEYGIFINQDKYVAEILKKFGLTEGKSASTPIDTEKPLLKDPDVKRIFRYLKGKPNLGLWYPKDSPFDLVSYSNSDYAGASLDRKSTTGGCQFLRSRLISWQCKKQTVIATSSTEAKYAAGASCCAQVLWIQNQMLDYGTVAVKSSNDVTRLQALVDKKRVVVTEAAIRDALHLDDAEGVDCLPNKEIFTELARMGYEKPTTKLTFYKAFFSSQWKFLIHTILQSMSAKRTSWNEFSSVMAYAVICLSTGRKFNFSKYIFESLVQSPPPQQQSPPPAQPHGAHFPMSLLQEALDACVALTRCVEHLEHDKVAQDLEILKLKTRVKKLERANKVKTVKLKRLRKVGTSQRIESSDDTFMKDVSTQGREFNRAEDTVKITEEVREYTADTQVEGRQADIYHIDMDHAAKVLSMQEDESEVQEAVEVVTTAKLITEVVAAVSETVSAAAVIPSAVLETISAAAIPTVTAPSIKVAAPVKTAVPSTRRKRGVVIRDPEEESFVKTPTETTSKDKGKGMSYDDIRPIFEAKFNANLEFLLKSKEQIEEEESRAIATINETPAQKVAKRRKLIEKAKKAESIKQHLQIVPDKDDDVFTEATPLARKVPVVDYQTMFERPDGQDNVRRNQSTVHGQALVKSWKLLTSCGVHIISFNTTQIILLVERRYPLTKFTLEQMLNVTKVDAAGYCCQLVLQRRMTLLSQVKTVSVKCCCSMMKESKKLQTEAQARKNMMVYLKNVAGFKMDYFKGIALKRLNETPSEKAAKRQKLDEEVEELKRHLQIVPNEEDDVYTEATPLTRKVPVINYEIIEMNNKPYYKIIRADGTHQMLNAIRLEVEEESEVSLELLSFGVDAAQGTQEKYAKCLMLLLKDLVLPSQDNNAETN